MVVKFINLSFTSKDSLQISGVPLSLISKLVGNRQPIGWRGGGGRVAKICLREAGIKCQMCQSNSVIISIECFYEPVENMKFLRHIVVDHFNRNCALHHGYLPQQAAAAYISLAKEPTLTQYLVTQQEVIYGNTLVCPFQQVLVKMSTSFQCFQKQYTGNKQFTKSRNQGQVRAVMILVFSYMDDVLMKFPLRF